MNKRVGDKQGLGWFSAVMLLVLFSSFPAWSLDLTHEIAKQEADAAQILGSLGRNKSVVKSKAGKRDSLKVKLVRSPKARRRG